MTQMENETTGCGASCVNLLRTKYRSSQSVLKEYGHWEKPSEIDAREKFVATHTHHNIFDYNAPLKDLKEFGEGVLLYFYLLKYTAYVFAVLAVFPALPLIIFNGLGGWYIKADVERTSLGNFGLLSFDGNSAELAAAANITFGRSGRSATTEGAVTALFMSTANVSSVKVAGMDKRQLLVAMSVMDLLGVLIFFAYCCYMLWFVRATANAADRNTTTIKDYSVRVDRLPPDTHSAALKDYLQARAGEGAEVVAVELCRKVHTLLALVMEREEALDSGDSALAVLQRSAECYPKVPVDLEVDVLDAKFRRADLEDLIRQEQAAVEKNQVVTAFVTFSAAELRYKAMEALPRSRMRQWRMPAADKFNNAGMGSAGRRPVALDVVPAPEPSDVQYENLEFGPWERAARLVASTIAKYLVLLVGFLVVSLAPALRMGLNASGADTTLAACAASCSYTDAAGNYVLSDANRALYKGCDPVAGTGTLANKLDCEDQSICYECFCRASLTSNQYGELLYCSRFSGVVALSTGAQALAVLGIVIANTLIQYAIGWLTRLEKHHTRSKEAVSKARGLFITQFINTAFSNLVANWYLPGPAAALPTWLDGYIFGGKYADTTPAWYTDVGRPIVISVFLNTIITHAKIGFWWWWRRYKLSTRYRCLTQEQLDRSFEGHDFELAIKFGQHLYLIFVVMTYSSSMPLLYLLAAVHFATCYCSEKYELLKICKRPLTYSRDLAVYAAGTLPFACLWHLALGLWFYSLFGCPKSPLMVAAFRSSLESTLQGLKGLMSSASALTPVGVAARLTQSSSAHLFLGFLALAAALFVFFTLSNWLALMRWLASLLGVIKDSGAAGESEFSNTPEFAVAVRSQLLVGPATYSIHANPAYSHAFERMEQLHWEEKELEAKAAAMPEVFGGPAAAVASPGPAAALVRAFSRRSRQRRSAAGRLRARKQATAAAASGWAEEQPGTGYGGGGGGGALASNKVAPAPGPGAPMMPGFVAPVAFSIPGQGQGVVPTQQAAGRAAGAGGGLPRQDPNLVLSFN
ncbi:hypothetical protein HYH02_001577 [Chlamydomonas schloesseri]|uniref:CSC1/OSCA1-like cytosolic domain-containing protein n=1 Tax=Chlamydomonas schloesseri TaxID=2026947 RepID=A0A836BBI1_9CHLO|nr:hypothetical protein HYH02_001577 [Chlamydomonas schloesseri]|eukprot:KAG2453353.1 hypothetical protein HYH02_001577 [Chlamydomonas schloesseri]